MPPWPGPAIALNLRNWKRVGVTISAYSHRPPTGAAAKRLIASTMRSSYAV
jgi:hypothetical protein